jgi:uncharacterized membrane protein YgdD (TMEM256/DUF423 family)
LNGALAVGFGAVGAHLLEATASAQRVEWVETAATYQLAHAPVLVALAWVATVWRTRLVPMAGAAFVIGAVLFSGGLYVTALADWRGLVFVVPVGGISYIVGWLFLLGAALRRGGP